LDGTYIAREKPDNLDLKQELLRKKEEKKKLNQHVSERMAQKQAM